MDLKVLQFKNKKLAERLEQRQAVEDELRERIEKLEKRQATDDATLLLVNRYWGQVGARNPHLLPLKSNLVAPNPDVFTPKSNIVAPKPTLWTQIPKICPQISSFCPKISSF